MSNLGILHLSSDYPFTALYQQLLMHFSPSVGQSHTMYVPLQAGRVISHKYDYECDHVRLIYSVDYQSTDRFAYHRKRRRIYSTLIQQVPLSDVNLVHAHYLFSAGGIAYEIKQRLGTKYIAAVRNSDMNYFFRFGFHLRRFGVKVLQEASKIVFISPSYRDLLINRYVPMELRHSIRAKSSVIPNGVDDYWLNNVYRREPHKDSRTVRLLFVGELSRNKNIETSIGVTKLLRRRGLDASIAIVGDGPDEHRIRAMASDSDGVVQVHGRIESKDELRSMYRMADVFIMPSLAETFGLVYVEAMSQGLPLIYTRGQGIDGYFDDGLVGYACNPRDPKGIADQVERILDRYDAVSTACVASAKNFAWDDIASRYSAMYKEICSVR